MRSAVIIAVLFLVASANGMGFNQLKAQRQTVLQQQQQQHTRSARSALTSTSTSTSHFVIQHVDNMLPRCVDVGPAHCKKLLDAVALADAKVKAMGVYLTAHGNDAHFVTAFGAAPVAAVRTCLDAMALDASVLRLWNALSNKDGTVYNEAKKHDAWPGLGVMPGTNKLLVGSTAYTQTLATLAGSLVHEASHAFCATVDLHGGLNGYETSPHFGAVKGATNADSYRVYANLVAP